MRAKMLLSSYGGRPFTGMAVAPLASGDFRRIEPDGNREVPRPRRLLRDSADALAALQLVPHLLRTDAAGDPQHDQVIEHVGAFGDHCVAVAGDRLDQALD